MDAAKWENRAAFHNVLGAVMHYDRPKRPAVLDVVAFVGDRSGEGLARGQVGTVVEALQDDKFLVEFSDDEGRAYAVLPCADSDLLVLHYQPQAT